MKYYYDFEFYAYGPIVDPLSIGMVAEDGREYYAVYRNADWSEVYNEPWLMENVVPYLPTRQLNGRTLIDYRHPDVKSTPQIAKDLKDFVGNDSDVEFWAYYGSYDHVCLGGTFGKLIHLPDGWPMLSRDLKVELDRAGINAYDLGISNTELHNALADARWNKAVYDALGNR